MAFGMRNTPIEILRPRLMLCVSVFALLLIGLVMVYSSSFVEAINEGSDPSSYLVKQLLFTGVGLAAIAVIWNFFPAHYWRGSLMWIIWVVCLALLILTAVMGTIGLGAKRWIWIGFTSLQPSEFAKIVIVIAAAFLITQYVEREMSMKNLMLFGALAVVLPMLIIYKAQSDLGTTVIIAVGVIAAWWIGGLDRRVFAVIIIAIIIFGLYSILGTGYRSDRLLVFLNPWNDGEGGYGDGYQSIRSFYGFAEGGLFGVGLGDGAEKYLYLPEAETDFIFAIIGEELGMVGALVVIILFLLVLYSGLEIARTAENPLSCIIAGSLTVMLVFQAFLNIGCVVGVFPTTGKPLPFVSSGGSSLIASLCMVGVILSVSKEAEEADPHARRRENLFVVREEEDALSRTPRFSAVQGERFSRGFEATRGYKPAPRKASGYSRVRERQRR